MFKRYMSFSVLFLAPSRNSMFDIFLKNVEKSKLLIGIFLNTTIVGSVGGFWSKKPF